jgi:serine/threonine protein kinase
MTEREIFTAALNKEDPAERTAFLDEACAADDSLRRRVESLLAEHQQLGSFMDVPSSAATLDPPPLERPGTQIGPYKLLQQIGEGGMGVVYMAEQTEPVQRKVALKVIKAGMDTGQVIARFEAERQALALMDHPNIAKVFDAGETASGRPFFVMELVKGLAITDYCDQAHLTPRERLELFVGVCQAVQHAHQKGIIHRDLKPSNVLVALYDGKPSIKVIDFGVAKATGGQLTDKTLFTGFAQLIGTPLYMSPEQAGQSPDIDTRSDIYSLGVLLYELLTGTTPFDRERFKQAAYDEICRIIREEEPPKPSTRLSESKDTLPSISAVRQTEPVKLAKLVRGELDWVVMKALEKDRNRRYETANGLALDLQRYLNDEPVQACPPSAMYRFRKFARRNRATLAAGALLAMSLLVALGGIASGIGWAVRDRAAREEQLAQERTARQERVTGQLEVILDEVARLQLAEKWSEALVAARRAEPALAAGEAQPEIQARVRQALADLELVRRLEEVRAESGTVWGSLDPGLKPLAVRADQEYAAAFREARIDVDALPLNEAVDRITDRRSIATAVLPALDDWVAVRSKAKDEAATRRLIEVLRGADPDPWRQQVRDALGRKDWLTLDNLAKSPELDRQPAATMSFLCAALRAQAESDIDTPGKVEGELGPRGFFIEIDILRRAQRKYPADYWINHRLGVDLIWLQSPPHVVQDGIGYMRAAVALRPESAHSVRNLGNGYHALGELDQAIACFRKAIELNPHFGYSHLGTVLAEKGLYEEAIAAYEQAIERRPDVANAYAGLSLIHSNRPEAHLRNARRAAESAEKAVELNPQVSNHWTALGIARYRESHWQEARTAIDKSLQLGTDGPGGATRWADAINWFFLAMCHRQLAQTEEARQCYEKGVAWMEKNQPNSEQLIRVRAEAEELLKNTDEKPTTKPPIELK